MKREGLDDLTQALKLFKPVVPFIAKQGEVVTKLQFEREMREPRYNLTGQ